MAIQFETLDYDVGGTKTVIKAIGQGKPVLFLHGAATLEGFDFAEGLADRFRVLLPSHPGFGFSGDAPHVASMSDMVLHYLNLLDALELDEKPHLMGFSLGGWMASELAGLARERFDRVVLVAPAGLNDPAHPATDLGAVAPQDLPGCLAHDVSVALRYFPDGSDPAFAEAFGADRAREGEDSRTASGSIRHGAPKPAPVPGAYHESGAGRLGHRRPDASGEPGAPLCRCAAGRPADPG